MSRGSMANHFITQCGPCPDGTYQPRVSVLLRPVVGRVMATIKDSRRIEGNAALTWMEQRRGDTPRRRCTVHTYSHKHQGLCKYLKCRNLRECLWGKWLAGPSHVTPLCFQSSVRADFSGRLPRIVASEFLEKQLESWNSRELAGTWQFKAFWYRNAKGYDAGDNRVIGADYLLRGRQVAQGS